MAKSLTFWSIIIGLLLALETALVINVYNIFIEHGFYYTANTAVYKISLLLGAAILILLMSFYYIERDQNTKAQDITDKMIKAIDANTEELKKISIAIQQSYSQIELVAKLITVRSCFSLAINRLVEGSSPSSGANPPPLLHSTCVGHCLQPPLLVFMAASLPGEVLRHNNYGVFLAVRTRQLETCRVLLDSKIENKYIEGEFDRKK